MTGMASAVGRAHGGVGDRRVQPGGDVLDGPAGVQVRRPPDADPLTVGRDVVHGVPGVGHDLLGGLVQGDPRLTAGGPLTPPAGRLHQLADGVPAVAEDLRRPPHGRRDDLPVDDDDAQVVAVHQFLDEHVGAELQCDRDRPLQPVVVAHADGDPAALLAPRGLDHDAADLRHQRGRRGEVAVGGHGAAGDPDRRPLHDPAGHPLVVAAAHRHRGGELRQRLAGEHRAPADRQPHLAPLRIGHLDPDPAAQRLLGDDRGVGVEVLQPRRAGGEQGRVDRVLPLHADRSDAGETELAVEGDGPLVVVHDRQIEVGPAAADVPLGEHPDQRLTDPGRRVLGVHRQAPQARAALGVAEREPVVDAGDGADDLPGAAVLGDEIGEAARAVVAPHDVGVADHHPVEGVDVVDLVHLGLRRHRPHEDPADQLRPRAVAVQVEPEGVARVDEQLVRREAHEHMRVARVDADVPLPALLGAECVDDVAEVGEGLAEDQPAPAEVDDDVGSHALELVLRRLLPRPAGDRRRRGHGRPAAVSGHAGCGRHVRPRASAARARAGPVARACCHPAG